MSAASSLPLLALALATLLSNGCERRARTVVGVRDAGAGADAAVEARGPLRRREVDGKWGFVNPAGRLVIPATYAWAEEPSEGLAAVKVGEKWGYVDEAGKLVIEPRYRDADRFEEGLAAVRTDVGWLFIDKAGAIRVAGPFESARAFRCGVAAVKFERAFFLGTRLHGEYAYDLAAAAPWPKNEDAELTGLDDAALEWLYGIAARGISWGRHIAHTHDLSGTRLSLLLREPQWEEHAWRTIDARGEIVPPSLAPACGAPRAAKAAPADLRKRIEQLHRAKDRSPFFQEMAELGPPAVPALVDCLSDPKKQVRANALETLVRIGPAAAPAVSALRGARDRFPGLVESALARIAPDDPEVRAMLDAPPNRSKKGKGP